MKNSLVFLMLLLLHPINVQAQQERRDGNWWVEETPAAKLNYAVGFFDGMELGNRFSYWGMKDADKHAPTPCQSDAAKSYGDYSDKFFSHVTNDQLVDGLDTFYKDYRNRRIKVFDAVWLVVNGIAGTPQKKMDDMTESFRQSAPNH